MPETYVPISSLLISTIIIIDDAALLLPAFDIIYLIGLSNCVYLQGCEGAGTPSARARRYLTMKYGNMTHALIFHVPEMQSQLIHDF